MWKSVTVHISKSILYFNLFENFDKFIFPVFSLYQSEFLLTNSKFFYNIQHQLNYFSLTEIKTSFFIITNLIIHIFEVLGVIYIVFVYFSFQVICHFKRKAVE